GIVSKFAISAVAGYSEVHFNKVISLFPTFLQLLTASSISDKLATPVEIITGFPLLATYSINGKSVISKDAILYFGTPMLSKKSTALKSKGDEKNSMPKLSAKLLSLGCHSYGIAPSVNTS